MSKPKSFPERVIIRLPAGACSRIDRINGVDPGEVRSGQEIRGGTIRAWIIERIEREEKRRSSGGDAAGAIAEAVGSALPARVVELVSAAASLLMDPDESVRKRMEAQILIAADFRRRRRESGG